MIKGIGLDLVEVDRIKRTAARQPRFYKRILTVKEQEKYLRLSGRRQDEYLSGRFAAKEAYAKACGLGIGTFLSFQDLEIFNDSAGKPAIICKTSNEEDKLHLSITHTKEYAAAQVLIESSSS
ncbi:holo-ACP synthase [Metabacillus sp. RGM 3146]|uniref:holo-ACP synthase n=1 Tax=Metabacillus sp. RGM 3146 TaxID=3401092 RepID=UPI003B99A1C1